MVGRDFFISRSSALPAASVPPPVRPGVGLNCPDLNGQATGKQSKQGATAVAAPMGSMWMGSTDQILRLMNIESLAILEYLRPNRGMCCFSRGPLPRALEKRVGVGLIIVVGHG